MKVKGNKHEKRSNNRSTTQFYRFTEKNLETQKPNKKPVYKQFSGGAISNNANT